MFIAIYLEKHPEEGPQLMSYMDHIYTLSLERPVSYRWRLYEDNFHKARSLLTNKTEDMPWHITVEQLIREAGGIASTNKLPTGSGFRQFPNIQNPNQQRNSDFRSSNACNDYNNSNKGCS